MTATTLIEEPATILVPGELYLLDTLTANLYKSDLMLKDPSTFRTFMQAEIRLNTRSTRDDSKSAAWIPFVCLTPLAPKRFETSHDKFMSKAACMVLAPRVGVACFVAYNTISLGDYVRKIVSGSQ